MNWWNVGLSILAVIILAFVIYLAIKFPLNLIAFAAVIFVMHDYVKGHPK